MGSLYVELAIKTAVFIWCNTDGKLRQVDLVCGNGFCRVAGWDSTPSFPHAMPAPYHCSATHAGPKSYHCNATPAEPAPYHYTTAALLMPGQRLTTTPLQRYSWRASALPQHHCSAAHAGPAPYRTTTALLICYQDDNLTHTISDSFSSLTSVWDICIYLLSS